MNGIVKRAVVLLIATVIVLMLVPRGVLSQTASPTNIAAVRERLAGETAAGTPSAATGARAIAPAPSLKEILARAEKAMGGSDGWKKTNTIFMKGVLQTEDSSAFVAIEVYKKAPDKSLLKMKLPQDLEVREVCDGKTVWVEDPRGGYHEFKGEELQSRLRRSKFSEQAEMILLAATGKVLGADKIGLKDVYVVEFSAQKNETTKLSFDAETGLLVRSEESYSKPDGIYTVKLDMDDYRTVDWMMAPFKMKRTEKGSVMRIRLTQVKNNVPIDDEMFLKPATAKQ
jgi:outer membrane lipoprotein-sorting protein